MSIFRRRLLFQQSYLPKWFTDSLVCWYDVGKQGASNYSLKKNPILKDFSKNHLDMSLHNFNYSQDSGINGNGALVFDGVDDYGVSENQPILTDYTVIAKREFISRASTTQFFAIKGCNDSMGTSSFILEAAYDSSLKYSCYNFGALLTNIEPPKLITYMSSHDYNGIKIKKGNDIDGSILTIGGYLHNDFGNVALYQFLLFNRTLTPEEIDWVKSNIMGDTPSITFDDGSEILWDNGDEIIYE